jgi:hypothetical protein
MKTIKYAILFALILTACFISPNSKVSAQTNLSGTWKANDFEWKNNKNKADNDDESDELFEKEDVKNQIQLNFRYNKNRGNNSQSSTFKFSDIQGLSKEQVNGSNISVNFRIAREAGTIECEGKFNGGKGEGNFKFTGNQSFADAMQNHGFSFSDEKLFTAAFLDVTIAFVDDIKSTGFENLDTEDLFKARIFKIDSKYMQEMAATGFPNLDMEDLVKARIFKITPKFVREVTKMGFAKDSLEDLVKLRIFKITPEYLREMRALGFDHLSAEDATKLRIFKVTAEFMREMQNEGLSDLSVEDATKLRIFKIDGEYIRLARSKGYKDLDVEKLVDMKIFNRVR